MARKNSRKLLILCKEKDFYKKIKLKKTLVNNFKTKIKKLKIII